MKVKTRTKGQKKTRKIIYSYTKGISNNDTRKRQAARNKKGEWIFDVEAGKGAGGVESTRVEGTVQISMQRRQSINAECEIIRSVKAGHEALSGHAIVILHVGH